MEFRKEDNEVIINQNEPCSSIFGLLASTSNGIIESFHSDLWHDAIFLDKKNRELSLVERYINLGESIFWSVGPNGSHIGIMTNASQRPWMESYGNYNHFKIEIIISESGLAYANLRQIG